MSSNKYHRREFLRRTLGAGAGLGLRQSGGTKNLTAEDSGEKRDAPPVKELKRAFNSVYEGLHTQQIAFPLGGLGAGMLCLEGSGALSKLAINNRPDFGNEHLLFAALSVVGAAGGGRVLEAPVPAWKLRPQFPGADGTGCWGLPRLNSSEFKAGFPFAAVDLLDARSPFEITVTGWSPFSPGDADNSSLPAAGLEYRFTNRDRTVVDAIFSFNAENFMSKTPPWQLDEGCADRIFETQGGFILYGSGSPERPWDAGSFAAWVDDSNAEIDYAWPVNSLDILWRSFSAGRYVARTPVPDFPAAGASIFVPFRLAPGEERTITLSFAWYVPKSDLFQPQSGRNGEDIVTYTRPPTRYEPWYVRRFSNINDVVRFWRANYNSLRKASRLFAEALQDSTLPPEVLEAVAANLSVLKSPTVLRQPDGRLWGWEGTVMESADDDRTGVSGTTTHVWNYAQAVPHLFPALERGLRETEFTTNQNEDGLQYCRTPLPIRPVDPGHSFPDGPAADGQLGGIIKVYREWRISGDTAWLRRIWPKVRASLDYCIRTWDPERSGLITEPHLTTYDVEFCGADSLCTSLYLGALKAAALMGVAVGNASEDYFKLLSAGKARATSILFQGEFFIQKTEWRTLHRLSKSNMSRTGMNGQSIEWRDLTEREGPPNQYGSGCLSDGMLGEWLCLVSGLEGVLDQTHVKSHIASVHRYNFRSTLVDHTNFARASFACGNESGLLTCSWPKGGRPSVPFVCTDEVWTGTEYQVASHLIALGMVERGLDIVRAVRERYDGCTRNPFSEVEAGDWYARAMSSYALLYAFSGARFDAVDGILYLRPAIKGDFRCFLSTETGFGTVGVKNGQPFVEIVSGRIPYKAIHYTPKENLEQGLFDQIGTQSSNTPHSDRT